MKKLLYVFLIVLASSMVGCGTSNKMHTVYEVHYFNGVDIEKYIASDITYFDTNRAWIVTQDGGIMLNGDFKVIYK